MPGSDTATSRSVMVVVVTSTSTDCTSVVSPRSWLTVLPSSKTHSTLSMRRLPWYQSTAPPRGPTAVLA